MQAAPGILTVPAAMPSLQPAGASFCRCWRSCQSLEHWPHLEHLDPAGLAADLLVRHPQGGPLWLLGHSAGALVALALAQRLEQQGLNLVTKNHCNLNSPSLKGMGKGEVKLMVKQPWVSHKKHLL